MLILVMGMDTINVSLRGNHKRKVGSINSESSTLAVKVKLSKYLLVGFTRTILPKVTSILPSSGLKLAMNKVFWSGLLNEEGLGFTTNKTIIIVRTKMVTMSVSANAVLFITAPNSNTLNRD